MLVLVDTGSAVTLQLRKEICPGNLQPSLVPRPTSQLRMEYITAYASSGSGVLLYKFLSSDYIILHTTSCMNNIIFRKNAISVFML